MGWVKVIDTWARKCLFMFRGREEPVKDMRCSQIKENKKSKFHSADFEYHFQNAWFLSASNNSLLTSNSVILPILIQSLLPCWINVFFWLVSCLNFSFHRAPVLKTHFLVPIFLPQYKDYCGVLWQLNHDGPVIQGGNKLCSLGKWSWSLEASTGSRTAGEETRDGLTSKL